MENASKALIIAGAILLAILLISFGIIIIRQGGTIVNNSGMSEAELQMYNEKFLKYEGKIKGSKVRSLIQEVNAANANEQNPYVKFDNTGIIDKVVDITTDKLETKEERFLYKATDKLLNTNTYEVTASYDKSGRVEKLTVKKT